jgi:hypothetical protein
MASEGTSGLMGELTVGNGRMTKCMVVEYFNGVMEECILDVILMIKNVGKVYSSGKFLIFYYYYFLGQMEEDMLVFGRMANNMEKGSLKHKMAKVNRGNGKMDKEKDG